MSASVSYEAAKQTLGKILEDKLFHTPSRPTPWWMRALKWLIQHLHLNLGAHTLRDVGLALAGVCVLVVITAVLVFWRFLHRRTDSRVIRITPSHINVEPLIHQATAAYHAGDYEQMLHSLIEAGLAYATANGWVRLRPSKTLRAYSQELSRTDTAFTTTFVLCAGAAERVWFGRQPLSDGEAARILHEVTEALAVKGANVS